MLLNYKTVEVCNCLIQFLLARSLSIEERVFLVEYVFREVNRYTDLVMEQFAEHFPEIPVPHRNAILRLTEKFGETNSVLKGNYCSQLNAHFLVIESFFFIIYSTCFGPH
jgi:hypothetical protein